MYIACVIPPVLLKYPNYFKRKSISIMGGYRNFKKDKYMFNFEI